MFVNFPKKIPDRPIRRQQLRRPFLRKRIPAEALVLHRDRFRSVHRTGPDKVENDPAFRVSGFDQNGGECADDWRDILPRESEFLQNPQPRDYRYLGSCDTGYLEEASIEISTDAPAPFELAALAINAKG